MRRACQPCKQESCHFAANRGSRAESPIGTNRATALTVELTRQLRAGALVLLSAVIIDAVMLAAKWPFTRNAILSTLREQSNGQVTVRGFRPIFPAARLYPLRSASSAGPERGEPPMVSAGRVVIRGDYHALFTFSKHLNEIETEDVHIRIPRDGGVKGNPANSAVTADRLIATRTVLEFTPSKPGDEPYILPVHRVLLRPASLSQAIHFETALTIPEPGEVFARGHSVRGNTMDTGHTYRVIIDSAAPIWAISGEWPGHSVPPALSKEPLP